MKKHRLYVVTAIIVLLFALLFGFLIVWGREEVQDWHDLPFSVPTARWNKTFEDVAEVFALQERLAKEERNGEEQRDLRDFFQTMETIYLPIGKCDWVFATYAHDVMLSLTYIEESIYMMTIVTNDRFSRNSLDFGREAAKDITELLLSYKKEISVGNDQKESGLEEAVLRVGDGIVVFQTVPFEPDNPDGVARFFLDVQGVYVAMFFHGVSEEEDIFQTLANLEFGLGLAGW